MRLRTLAALCAAAMALTPGLSDAQAGVTPACIPTSSTPFTVIVPGVTAFDLALGRVALVMAPLSDPEAFARGSFSGAVVDSSGMTATAVFPAGLIDGTYGIVATIGGTMPQFVSVGTIEIGCGGVGDATITTVSCVPGRLSPGDSTVCTATVSDSAAAPSTPSGSVEFSRTGTGVFSPSPCPVSASGPSAGCATSFSSPEVGSQTITARYSGDTGHTASTGSTTVTVAVPPSSPGCRVLARGRLVVPGGDRAGFGLLAFARPALGATRFTDRGPASRLQLRSHHIEAVVCGAGDRSASVFGTGSTGGAGGPVGYRIDVTRGRAESGRATYRLALSNGFVAGGPLLRGAVRISSGRAVW